MSNDFKDEYTLPRLKCNIVAQDEISHIDTMVAEHDFSQHEEVREWLKDVEQDLSLIRRALKHMIAEYDLPDYVGVKKETK